MKTYEVVRDRKSGGTRVLSREERSALVAAADADPEAAERRARVASLRAWAAGLRFLARDRFWNARLFGYFFFWMAVLGSWMTVGIIAAMADLVESQDARSNTRLFAEATALLIAIAATPFFVRAAWRRFFGD
jgi:hypothetical protein